MKWLIKIDRYFEEIAAAILITIVSVLLFLQVIFRYGINLPLDWTEETSRYLFIAFTFISASLAVKYNRHLRIDIFLSIVPMRFKKYISIFRDMVWLVFALLLVKIGYEVALVNFESGQLSPSLQLQMGVVYLMLPIGFAFMSIRILQKIYRTAIGKELPQGE